MTWPRRVAPSPPSCGFRRRLHECEIVPHDFVPRHRSSIHDGPLQGTPRTSISDAARPPLPCGVMRALVISHDPSEVAGRVGLRLEQHGYRLDVFTVCDDADDPVSHRPFPGPDRYDLVVAMGAPWSVYDTATIGTWIGRERDFVRAVHDRGVPYLGICFGAQVLAAAL